jgi:FkbM family methyltransferase
MPNGGEMELFLYDSAAFNNFLQHNSHEAGEVRFLESVIRPGMKVIDVGANIGITSVTIARKIGKDGKLYSFEPVPEYFRVLQQNLYSNQIENAEAFPLALSDRTGETEFYLKELSSGIVFEKEAKKTRVSTVTIDSFLQQHEVERIDLINMDCEGSELSVLRGAKQTLRKNKVSIFCEIHHDFLKQLGQSIGDVVKYLQSLEFQVQSVSLDDLKVGNNFEKCDYIYAHNLNERKNYAHLRL